MIVLDASAIVAILEREPEAAQFTAAVSSATSTHASVVSIQECAMVLFSRHGQAGLDALWRFIADADVEIVTYDEAQLRAAIKAFTQRHPREGTPEHGRLRVLCPRQDARSAAALQGQRLCRDRHHAGHVIRCMARNAARSPTLPTVRRTEKGQRIDFFRDPLLMMQAAPLTCR